MPLTLHSVVPAYFSKFTSCPFSVLSSLCVCSPEVLLSGLPPFACKLFPFSSYCSEAAVLRSFFSKAGILPLSCAPTVVITRTLSLLFLWPSLPIG